MRGDYAEGCFTGAVTVAISKLQDGSSDVRATENIEKPDNYSPGN